ncbi:MAG TPA: cell division protein FtsQ/DivIB [Rhodocyclaceae bacterium]|nr:cell division protein FtsQ/DivIB [Rhodocyclaceae bacterium]
MWNNPRLLLATADLLWLSGGLLLLAALAIWGSRQPIAPLSRVVVINELKEVQRADIEQALQGLRGNMISVSLDGVRTALEKLAWVRRAEVRRRWPATLELTLHEQEAVARWGDGSQQLVNVQGEVFYAPGAQRRLDGLPLFQGPIGSAPELLARYREASTVLQPTGRLPRQVTLTPRQAWLLRLDDGLWIELGREQAKAPVLTRLQRFAEVYESVVAARPVKPTLIDLRYPNGFVMRVAGAVPGGAEIRGNT